jgi:hypothetical protein
LLSMGITSEAINVGRFEALHVGSNLLTFK